MVQFACSHEDLNSLRSTRLVRTQLGCQYDRTNGRTYARTDGRTYVRTYCERKSVNSVRSLLNLHSVYGKGAGRKHVCVWRRCFSFAGGVRNGRTPAFFVRPFFAPMFHFGLGDHAKKRHSSQILLLLKKISDPTGARIFRARVESEIFFKSTKI